MCHRCLVGEFIPVCRPSVRRFMFGQVLDSRMNDENGLQFCMSFDSLDHTSSCKEWLKVASEPFELYLQHHQPQFGRKSGHETVSSPQCGRPLCQDPEFPMERMGGRSDIHSFFTPTSTKSEMTNLSMAGTMDNFHSLWSVPCQLESNVSQLFTI